MKNYLFLIHNSDKKIIKTRIVCKIEFFENCRL